jgi:hypothetical protein
MGVSIMAGGTALPSPTELTVSEEIIWSANTGRGASGLMLGDVVAEKETFEIRWGVLTAAQREEIRSRLVSGFFPVTVTIGDTAVTLTVYRGTLTGNILGTFGGVTYYRDTAVTVIQQ